MSNASKHWINVHRLDDQNRPITSTIADALRKKLPEHYGPLPTRFQAFKRTLILWIVFAHIAIHQLLSGGFFIEVVKTISVEIAKMLPKRDTLRRWVLELYFEEKKRLKKRLHRSKSRIHISFDLWSSPNYYALLAVVAHFIDHEGQRQQVLLAIKPVEGEHTGLNIASVILQMFKEYRIGKKIGYFVTDNASNNNTAIDAVLRALYPQMTKKQRQQRRLRCLGHVINICAQRFIHGHNAEDAVKELGEYFMRGDYEAIDRFWRSKGPLGKLHNLIRYIRITPQRRQEFAGYVSVDQDYVEFNNLMVSRIALSYPDNLIGQFVITCCAKPNPNTLIRNQLVSAPQSGWRPACQEHPTFSYLLNINTKMRSNCIYFLYNCCRMLLRVE